MFFAALPVRILLSVRILLATPAFRSVGTVVSRAVGVRVVDRRIIAILKERAKIICALLFGVPLRFRLVLFLLAVVPQRVVRSVLGALFPIVFPRVGPILGFVGREEILFDAVFEIPVIFTPEVDVIDFRASVDARVRAAVGRVLILRVGPVLFGGSGDKLVDVKEQPGFRRFFICAGVGVKFIENSLHQIGIRARDGSQTFANFRRFAVGLALGAA